MSEWKEYSLEEITEPIKEAYIPTGNDSLFYIGLEHIEQESLRLNSIGKSTDVTSNKFKFIQDDVLFGKLRPYFRKVVKPNFSGICSTDIWVLRAKKKINQNFLFYFIANWDFVNLSNSGEGGTRMPRADWNYLKQTRWTIPSPKEQTAIASVLSSLDDKIDLLHRQNATLEKMAETLFRQWFVEEAKEEWKEGKLSELVIVKYGKDHKKILDGEIPVFGSGGLMRHVEKSLYNKESVLIPRKGSLNNVMYQDEPFWTVDTMFYTEMKIPNVAKFIYHFLKEQDLASMNVGSAVPSMTTEILNNMPLDIPPIEVFEKFEGVVAPLYAKTKSNQTQINTLSALRDTLLPKLMSGEIMVEV